MTTNTTANLFAADNQGVVDCFGMKFPNDEARRTYFLEMLKEKLIAQDDDQTSAA